ncbi:sulfotransferase family 2 domain-containing protein [Brevibacterium litoralis]|uniref:sulfotransferase family 2 domain-containing protein n=1 Tax=Brevibacterium litoralis TaxID=3138935 RepID=UPI0032EC336F
MSESAIVFLHVPKTAGQTIHNELVRLVGGEKYVSPVRVHTQARPEEQLRPGYRLYSGHIDWSAIDQLAARRFVFTVLRDPQERIASFYFYLLKEARELSREQLDLPENTGKQKILEESPDDYFFGGDAAWQDFIRDHYDNFYCNYFASRLMRGRGTLVDVSRSDLIERASTALEGLNGVYTTDRLDRLEDDIHMRFGVRISVTDSFVNAGDRPAGEERWPRLARTFDDEKNAERLAEYASADEELMTRIGASTR